MPSSFKVLVVSMVTIWCPLVTALKTIPGKPYPVYIGADAHTVQGRISSDAEAGSLIPMDHLEEGEVNLRPNSFLRVEVRESVYERPLVFHKDIIVNGTGVTFPQVNFTEAPEGKLPYGFRFVIQPEGEFAVNKDRYIVVRDLSEVTETKRLHFQVMLRDSLSTVPYISNHLPFSVEVEFSRSPGKSAMSAGVLVFAIVAISLIIPFVVRAKRRRKAGKPICGCGSASADDGSVSGSSEYSVKEHTVRGVDNLGILLDNGHPKHNHRVSIQNALIRSTSDLQWKHPGATMRFSDIRLDRQDLALHFAHHDQVLRRQTVPAIEFASAPPPGSKVTQERRSIADMPRVFVGEDGHGRDFGSSGAIEQVDLPRSRRFHPHVFGHRSRANLLNGGQDFLSVSAKRRRSSLTEIELADMSSATGGYNRTIDIAHNGMNPWPNGGASLSAAKSEDAIYSSSAPMTYSSMKSCLPITPQTVVVRL